MERDDARRERGRERRAGRGTSVARGGVAARARRRRRAWNARRARRAGRADARVRGGEERAGGCHHDDDGGTLSSKMPAGVPYLRLASCGVPRGGAGDAAGGVAVERHVRGRLETRGESVEVARDFVWRGGSTTGREDPIANTVSNPRSRGALREKRSRLPKSQTRSSASSSWIWRALGTPTRAQTACDRFATERASSRDRIPALWTSSASPRALGGRRPAAPACRGSTTRRAHFSRIEGRVRPGSP